MTQIVDERYAEAKRRRAQEMDADLRASFTQAYGRTRGLELLQVAMLGTEAAAPVQRSASRGSRRGPSHG